MLNLEFSIYMIRCTKLHIRLINNRLSVGEESNGEYLTKLIVPQMGPVHGHYMSCKQTDNPHSEKRTSIIII